jgi:hypothetical protein
VVTLEAANGNDRVALSLERVRQQELELPEFIPAQLNPARGIVPFDQQTKTQTTASILLLKRLLRSYLLLLRERSAAKD